MRADIGLMWDMMWRGRRNCGFPRLNNNNGRKQLLMPDDSRAVHGPSVSGFSYLARSTLGMQVWSGMHSPYGGVQVPEQTEKTDFKGGMADLCMFAGRPEASDSGGD